MKQANFKQQLALRTLRKVLLLVGLLTLAFSSQAQVTIGSGIEPDPNALLDLKEQTDGTSGKGLLLPRVALVGTTSPLPMTERVKGMVVYNTATISDVSPGFYYNDGDQWIRLAVEPWLISGTSAMAMSSTDNIYHMGHVTIGDIDVVDPTAVLNVNAVNKGVLLPRVQLSSATDAVTIPTPTVGLLVYNTGVGGLKTEGYLYWNGIEWVQFTTSPSRDPEIGSLDCVNARIVPSRYKQGEQYEGVLIVPYSGGNGGRYSSGAPVLSSGVTGLKATLQPGNLAYGNGDLVFTLSGTPSKSSPELATFDISFLGNNCQAIVGSNSMMQGEQTFWHGSMPANVYGSTVLASNYINNLPVIEDVFRMDAQFPFTSTSTSGVTLNPRMYNISANPIKIWASSMSSQEGYGYSNIIIPAGGYIEFDNGVYLNQGTSSSTTPSSGRLANNGQETVTIDLFYNGKWFRLYYTIWVDNKRANIVANMTRELYLSIQRLY